MSGASPGRWNDLGPRVVSGLVMAGVGAAAIQAGGWWFTALAALITGALVWEIRQMAATGTGPGQGQGPAAISRVEGLIPAALAFGLVMVVPLRGEAELLVAALCLSLAVAAGAGRERAFSWILSLAVLMAGYGLVEFRHGHGGTWIFWLLLVVIATDILGYFAGRLIGGPKFWPSLSPKKTWAGVIAGWIGAALIGWTFVSFTTAGWDTLWISICVSLASQLGDICESAFKRRTGVKDSSSLIPGHGGVFDRVDGMLGATLFVLVVALVVDIPQVRP